MGYNVKSLADGQLPISKATLYTAPTSTTAIVKLISLVNTDASSRTINLYFKSSGGTSRRIAPKNCSILPGYLVEMAREYTLEAGDSLEGDASVADVVDYVVNGIEVPNGAGV